MVSQPLTCPKTPIYHILKTYSSEVGSSLLLFILDRVDLVSNDAETTVLQHVRSQALLRDSSSGV